MRICVVSPSYPTKKTIVFVFVDQLVRAFADHGENVTVIAPQSLSRVIVHGDPLAKIYSQITTTNGAVIKLYRPLFISFGNGRFYSLTRALFKIAVSRSLRRNAMASDIVYGHFWSSIAAALPFSVKYNIPLFGASGEEDVAFYDHFSSREKELLRNEVRGVINVSSKNHDECVSLGLVLDSKTRIIPNAVNLKSFSGYNKEECRRKIGVKASDFVVGFMGQFVPRKGTLRLSKALDSIGDDSIKALFIGSGAEDPNYRNIIFKGRLDHDQIPLYLTACDVFVLPTENEGCSNAIVEALACGLPVISTDASFNYDILDESNSILIDSQSIAQIAEAIKKLKNDDLLRQKLSQGALEKAKELSLENRAERILSFIKEKI